MLAFCFPIQMHFSMLLANDTISQKELLQSYRFVVEMSINVASNCLDPVELLGRVLSSEVDARNLLLAMHHTVF